MHDTQTSKDFSIMFILGRKYSLFDFLLLHHPFCDPNILFVWHWSVDIYKASTILNFQFKLMLCLWFKHNNVSSSCIGHYVGIPDCWYPIQIQIWLIISLKKWICKIFPANMFLKASTGMKNIKISTILEKNVGMRLWIMKWGSKSFCTSFG